MAWMVVFGCGCQGCIDRAAAGTAWLFNPCRAALGCGANKIRASWCRRLGQSQVGKSPLLRRRSAPRRTASSHSGRMLSSSALEALRHLAAALCELGHDLIMQPDIHFGGAVELA